ncbi:MAG: hypothetical protein HY810_02355 [Candidatus Omnitrophica bacterium]|nr:hypothetical protein [Candidatus Omnitrophota bacterium]
MKIIAHRGLWKKANEKNTPDAFEKALKSGYGIEFDVRDYKKGLVIAHNMADKNSPGLYWVFDRLKKIESFSKVIFAVNIKCDSIEREVLKFLQDYGIIKNSFIFDMSFPATYVFKKYCEKINIAARQSEFEKEPFFYSQVQWLWLDEFEKHWIDNKTIVKHIENGKKVCIVSPELHGRNHEKAWAQYSKLPEKYFKYMALCTDFPDEAERFFITGEGR